MKIKAIEIPLSRFIWPVITWSIGVISVFTHGYYIVGTYYRLVVPNHLYGGLWASIIIAVLGLAWIVSRIHSELLDPWYDETKK